jgi:SAM-dependent methyltransferase
MARDAMANELSNLYRIRFAGASSYRQGVWKSLTQFLSRWITVEDSVLDLGCGHCEFINAVQCSHKFAMDLNPDSQILAKGDVTFIHTDCSEPWPLLQRIDVIFSSNFFEHLPTKASLHDTLLHAFEALHPGGTLICIGPNIKYLAGEYWDFIDHNLPLSHVSMCEALRAAGFEIERSIAKFLPYTMSGKQESPIWLPRLYLSLPAMWRVFGKQFLIVARKP